MEWKPPGGNDNETVDYLIEISRAGGDGAGLGTHTVETSLLLNPPTGLTANGNNPAAPSIPTLNITWNSVAHATGYIVKYCMENGNDCPDTVTTQQTYCVGDGKRDDCPGTDTPETTLSEQGTISVTITKDTGTHSALAAGQSYRIHVLAHDPTTGYQHHKSAWSTPTTTKTAPPPPTGLTANGDSRGAGRPTQPANSGQIVLNWEPASNTDFYQVRYTQCARPPTCGTNWTELSNKITGTTHTITGLALNQLYRVQIGSGNTGGTSDWSNKTRETAVLAYTTTARPPTDGSVAVAGISYRHDLSPLQYDYKICTNSMSSTWIKEIKQGFQEWTTALHGFTTPDGRQITASATEEPGTDCLSEDVRRVSFQTLTQVQQYCARATTRTLACVPTLRNNELVSKYAIFFVQRPGNNPASPLPDPNLVWENGSICTLRLEVAVHEAGHIFGLNHATINRNQSIMNGTVFTNATTNRLCGPQPMDIVALKALYQSDTTP